MTASHGLALDAIAFQLAAALETYEQSVQRMIETWLDKEQYRSVSAQVEEIRLYSVALPQLSGAWVELLIAHAELVHCLWSVQRPPASQGATADGRSLAQVREHHTVCVQALSSRCLRLISRVD